MITVQREDTLEEMWRIKRELSMQHGSWTEYAESLMAFQEAERREGVRYCTLPSCKAKV